MRSFKLVLPILIIIFTVNACKTAMTPEEVTEKFMNHLIAGEFSKAKEYGTESTQQMMQMFEALESLGGENFGDDELTPEGVKNIECGIDGDTAICRFEENGEQSEVNLLKVDGKWLVDMQKENPFGDMDFNDEMEWDIDEDMQ